MAWPTSAARTKTWGTEVLTASDLQGQFDLGFTYFNDSLNGSTGHGHTGGSNDGPKISLTAGVTGILPLANGGTGGSTLSALLNLVYPVGSIYTNYNVATNPATLLGFGTWVAIGGKFLVGLYGTTEFLSNLQTGGEKTHVLTIPEMPSHTHTSPLYSANNGGNSGVPQNTPGGADTTSNASNATGGGGAHNTLPPYIVIYMWYRSV
jgi:hypothetical protein